MARKASPNERTNAALIADLAAPVFVTKALGRIAAMSRLWLVSDDPRLLPQIPANRRLSFDRAASYGRHLYIPAGEHVDFPPGIEVAVNLIPITGNRILIGFAGLVDGPLDAPGAKESAIAKARSLGYLGFME